MAKNKLINLVPKELLTSFIHQHKEGLSINIKVKPNASIEKLSVQGSDYLCLSVNAQAIDNAANDRLIELVAELFSVAKSRISIISGQSSRLKRILIKP